MREARLYKTPVVDMENAMIDSTDRFNVFPLTLNSFAIETYYVFLDAPLPDYSLVIEEPLHHVRSIIRKTQTSHLFYGASLGVFLYALIYLVTTRMPIYLWFAGNVLAYTLAWSTRDGSALVFLPNLSIMTQNSLPWIFFTLSLIAYAKFFSEFLSLKSHCPTANNIIKGFVVIWIAMLPLELFVQINHVVEALAIVTFAFIGFQLSVLLPLVLQRQRDAIFYLGGASVKLVAVVILFAVYIDPFNVSSSTALNALDSFGQHLGQFVWMMVMTFALGVRFRELSVKEKEATRESQSKSSFLATMSHEIRTPMNGVLGMTELLNNTKMNAQQQNYVSTIYSSASALLTILDDILDYSKIQSGKLELERIPINLYDFVSDTVPLFAAMSRDKRVPLLVNVDEDLPAEIWGDPTRIRQILVNLLGNAFKFTSEGYIALDLRKEDGNLIVSIRDTGIGISTEDQAHVFTTFAQADSSTSRKFGGSGLGLSICNDLLLVMGGDIRVVSELGMGSDFIVRIPIDHSAEDTFLDQIPPDVRRLSILIFEPLEAKRTSMMRTLHGWGIQIRSATTIEEARQIMDSNANLDAVITSMSAMLEDLIRGPTENRLPKLIQLAMVTSSEEKSAGVDYVLEEPVSPGRLLAGLNELFSTQQVISPAAEDVHLSSRIAELRVLVAEDNEVNQRVICGLLNKLGIEPVVANNGSEAFQHYYDRQETESPFDLILMDCEMPQVDGYEATRLIRDHETTVGKNRGTHVDIVALTANVLPEHRKKAEDIGMDEFLTKPIRLAELQQLLSNL
jgi:signal transduction histidine kinase/CheY-like chemotaxis protein